MTLFIHDFSVMTEVCRKSSDAVNSISKEEHEVNYYFKVDVKPNVEISCNDNVSL